jgi:hypothetical protein
MSQNYSKENDVEGREEDDEEAERNWGPNTDCLELRLLQNAAIWLESCRDVRVC